MTDPPSLEESGIPDLEISEIEQHQDDLFSEAVLISSFEIAPDATGELSHGRGDNEETIDSTIPGEDGFTYAEMISHARVRAAIKRPVRLCKYHTIPTVLLALEINFFETAKTRQLPRLLRFKAVDVTIEFKPAPSDSGARKASTLGPEVVMFCPENYTGEPTVVTHHQSTTIGASIDSSSALPAGLSVGAHHTASSQYKKTSACTVTGRTLRVGSAARIIKWEINENAALKGGVPKSLRFVMAITNPEERPFSLKLNFNATLGLGNRQFEVKKSQKVMATKVDPMVLRELAKNHELGEEVGSLSLCLVDEEEVTSVDLGKLTNLEGSTVGRIYDFS